MQQMEPHNLIDASPLFRNMQPHETEAILARLQLSHYERGAHILERGRWDGRLYIIAAGQVSVLLQDTTGESLESASLELEQASVKTAAQTSYIVARLGPGECFGEMSLITGEPPTATIRAEDDATLWSLAQTDFLTLIGTCPTLVQNINTILSQRLARANQHLILNHAAEILLLAHIDTPTAPVERTLAFHIADALAMRTHKRVLLLELSGHDEATSIHFATHAEQIRPSLSACLHDRALLQAHRAPTLTSDGQHIPAVASLADTQQQAQTQDTNLLLALTDLCALYDYILLTTTARTPDHIIKALAEDHKEAQPHIIKRAMLLVSANTLNYINTSPLFGRATPYARSIFIIHTPEQPTIGLQDRYAQQTGHTITRLLPADDPLLQRCWQQQTTPRQISPDAALTKAIDFVARHIAHQTIGIAFGGGGARGFAHLGVLDSLLAHGIPLDYIAACSSGIIAPGMHLIGKSTPESEEIFLEIQRQIVQWRLPRTSIFSNRGLKRMLRSTCGELRFEDLTTPFAMVAADLTTRAGVVLERGPIWQAGLASVALPGIFPPVLLGKHILIDAGMHDPVPIRLVHQMGADILIASELGGQEPPTLTSATPWLEEAAHQQREPQPPASPHIIDLLLRTYDLAMATIGMHSIREADVVIRPKLHRVSLRQFSEGRKFVTAGREAVEQALPSLRTHLPWL